MKNKTILIQGKAQILKLVFIWCFILFTGFSFGQNPIIRDQFTADPSARVINGKVFVFPSHDIIAPEGKNLRPNWFCMEDYHVFSSENLTDWIDHGIIVSQYDAPWIDSSSYSMWAPDCIERNGKYYFYYPARSNEGNRRGSRIGVAVAENPEGPYNPQPKPIENVIGIDPAMFIDHDGQAYLYWSLGNLFVAKLKDNMLELDSEVKIIEEMPKEGLKEGPYLFERNGIYYMTYPHVENGTERLEYAIGDNPMGPFKFAGVIMDESPTGCWTNHQSIIEYKNQWYLFYHHNDYSPKFDKNRSIRVDSLFFNTDGTIQKVSPTLRGVGVADAKQKIQIDRYSHLSETGASIAFHDTLDTFKGWKTILENKDSWIQYNTVDFGKKKLKKVQVKATSEVGSTLEIRLDKVNGSVISEIEIPAGSDWEIVKAGTIKMKKGIHNIVVILKGNAAEIDWVRFEK
ncbi:MAG: family 43 glycosylhydrolase [Mariniphaga sp.]|nr:family 43 glycosylhydrolase [Mariniphaga sp.]